MNRYYFKKITAVYCRLLKAISNSSFGVMRVHPARHVLLGYMLYVFLGWLLLCIPFSQKGAGVSYLDNLFIVVSAISTTGLATVSVSDSYSLFGQLIILVLIQLGGIGYMTLGSFVILSTNTGLSEKRREISHTVFSLPDFFQIDNFIKSVIIFSLAIEVAGALALFFVFKSAGVDNLVWTSIFHSVSSFCTAGFSLYNNSLESFTDNYWLNIIISILSYLGAIGFIVIVDFAQMIRRKTVGMTVTSKIILLTTFCMSVIGTLLLFINEPSIQDMPVDKRLLAAFFQSMTSMTTVGFNSIPIGNMSNASILLIIIWMVIGASPSGTGGGIKSTSLSVLLGTMKSTIMSRRDVCFWGRIVPQERILMAVASIGFYLSFLLVGSYLLELTENNLFSENVFEAASALGTIGLSMGITASLTTMGKIIITLLMFCGRVSPLTLGVAMFLHKPPVVSERKCEDLAV